MGRVTRGRGGRYPRGMSFDEERGSPITMQLGILQYLQYIISVRSKFLVRPGVSSWVPISSWMSIFQKIHKNPIDFNDFHFLMFLRSRDLGRSTSLKRYVFSWRRVRTPLQIAAILKIMISAYIYQPQFSSGHLRFRTCLWNCDGTINYFQVYCKNLRPNSMFVLSR